METTCVEEDEIPDEELIRCQNHQFRRDQDVVGCLLKMILENSFEILSLSPLICDFSLWIRSALCHDQVIKQSVCLLKLILVSKKNGRSFRGKSETERSDL